MQDIKPKLDVDRARLRIALNGLLTNVAEDLQTRAMKLFENLTQEEIKRFGAVSEFHDAENQKVETQVQYYRLARLLVLGSMQARPEQGELWYLVGVEAIKPECKAIARIAKNRP